MSGPVDPPRPDHSNRFRRVIVQGLALTRILLLVLAATCALLRPTTVLAVERIQHRAATDLWVGPEPAARSLGQASSSSLSDFPIQADPSFTPALEQLFALQHTWTLQALATTGTRLEWALMAPDAAGSFRPDLGAIRFNARWYRSDPRALAALVEHEAKHVADALAGLDVASPAGCILTEINAFREEARTWGELVGPAGEPDPQDDLERSLNDKLRIYQQQPDTIQALITRSPGYQTQCKLR